VHRNTVGGGLEITVLNRQRKVVVQGAALRDVLERAWTVHPSTADCDNYSLTVCLVSDRRMRALNHEYRDRNTATDVLSFCDGEADPDGLATHLGDIVVSVETAQRQAEERGVTCEQELKTLALHGYLHLLGYDHEKDDGEMMRLQSRLERELINGTPSGQAG